MTFMRGRKTNRLLDDFTAVGSGNIQIQQQHGYVVPAVSEEIERGCTIIRFHYGEALFPQQLSDRSRRYSSSSTKSTVPLGISSCATSGAATVCSCCTVWLAQGQEDPKCCPLARRTQYTDAASVCEGFDSKRQHFLTR
jgi:hypothetical protein